MIFNSLNNQSQKQESVLWKEQVRALQRAETALDKEAFDVGSAHWNSQHTDKRLKRNIVWFRGETVRRLNLLLARNRAVF